MRIDRDRMSDVGAAATVKDICQGMAKFVENNPEAAKDLLMELVEQVLDPLDENDFFGTEGWEHYFGLGD